MGIGLRAAIPILRMHDLALTKRFYLDYLGFSLDGQDGEGDRPIFMKVSRDGCGYTCTHTTTTGRREQSSAL